ncbi:MAG: glycine zipper family protein [Oligoflexia bacterium]|nr:glycine zipper family protein [Oligoflexia bacterium]
MKYFIPLILLLSACSSSPVLYPNKKYQKVGKEVAMADVKKCEEKGDQFLESSRAKKILKGAGQGTVFGSAVGAVTGLLTGDFIQGLATGAAIGATSGAVGESITPDRLKQSFVTRCLNDQGYEVIGWD